MTLAFTFAAALLALGFAGWLAWRLWRLETGTPEMRAAADGLRKAALALLGGRLAVLGAAAGAAAALLYAALGLAGAGGHPAALRAAAAFLAGAFAAALAWTLASLAGWLGAVKTAAEITRSPGKGFAAAFEGAAAASIAAFAVLLAGTAALFFLARGLAEPQAAPLRMAAFCLGAAFAGLFAQLGGLTAGYPSGDGPAVAALRAEAGWRLGADLFSSASAQAAAALLLGAGLFPVLGLNGVLFPLVMAAVGLAASASGALAARGAGGEKPMNLLNRGYASVSAVSIAGLALAVYFLLGGSMWLFMAGLTGIVAGGLLVVTSYYYNGPKYRPARSVAAAASGGGFAAALAGISSALESAAAPVFLVAGALVGAYYCGVRGLEAFIELGLAGEASCGFFGAALASSGLLASAPYLYAACSLETAAAAAESLGRVTRQGEGARKDAGDLAALGAAVRPLGGGYAFGAAALAAAPLLAAYLDSVRAYSGLSFWTVNAAKAEIFAGLLAGAGLVCLFAALAAGAMPGSGAGEGPVRGLRRAALPGLAALAAPAAAGLAFRAFGLGAEGLGAFTLICAVCALLAGAAVDNCPGAWNAALRSPQAAGAAARQALLACAGAGDRLKSASPGPALYALAKLSAAAALVLVPLFI